MSANSFRGFDPRTNSALEDRNMRAGTGSSHDDEKAPLTIQVMHVCPWEYMGVCVCACVGVLVYVHICVRVKL